MKENIFKLIFTVQFLLVSVIYIPVVILSMYYIIPAHLNLVLYLLVLLYFIFMGYIHSKLFSRNNVNFYSSLFVLFISSFILINVTYINNSFASLASSSIKHETENYIAEESIYLITSHILPKEKSNKEKFSEVLNRGYTLIVGIYLKILVYFSVFPSIIFYVINKNNKKCA